MRKKDRIVIWPAYFDSTKTRSEGRRIPKRMAIPSPEIVELRKAVERLGLDYEEFLDTCYPKTPWLKTGMLLVLKKGKKCQVIKKISKILMNIRKEANKK